MNGQRYITIGARSLLLTTMLLCFLVLLILNASAQAQALPLPPQIVYPVSGNFVYLPNIDAEGNPPKSILINTGTGDAVTLFSRAEVSERISDPLWNTTGDHIAYEFARHVVSTQSISNLTLHRIPSDPSIVKIYTPVGWINGDQALFLQGFTSPPSQYSWHIADVATGQLSTALPSLAENDVVTSVFALPVQYATARLTYFRFAALNPVYQNWLLLFFNVTYDDVNEGLKGHVVALLYNYITQESIYLNDIIGELPIDIDKWSDDGKFISIAGSRSDFILKFDPSLSSTPSIVQQMPSLSSATGEQAEDFLGVQDLLLLTRRTDTQLIYEIGQIQAGQFYSQDFLIFDWPQTERGLEFDWHLTADEAERRTLSCLFDNAQPARISIGTRARVNFTDGTPLRLRAEPDFDAPEITQFPEGTEFDIIGGPACVNGDLYYRFWQLELDNGTIGWAAEASNSDYFIEPAT